MIWIATTSVQRSGQPFEVGYGSLSLASEGSSDVTGTGLVVDGGYLAR
jgi:NAD(P)-dependent dehydrogenase (short-subunit alcohol dehydrogenase family)